MKIYYLGTKTEKYYYVMIENLPQVVIVIENPAQYRLSNSFACANFCIKANEFQQVPTELVDYNETFSEPTLSRTWGWYNSSHNNLPYDYRCWCDYVPIERITVELRKIARVYEKNTGRKL